MARRYGLGVLALGALALALSADVGRADEEEQQAPRRKGFPGKGDDVQRLEQDLKRKIQEVEKLKQQLEQAGKSSKKGGEVRVAISGASKEEIARATAALKKVMPGKDVKVSGGEAKHATWQHPWGAFAHRGGWGGWGGHPMAHHKGDSKHDPRAHKAAEAKQAPRSSADSRLDSLEKKLDEIVKELAELRKERSSGGGRGGPFFKGGGPPRRE